MVGIPFRMNGTRRRYARATGWSAHGEVLADDGLLRDAHRRSALEKVI